MGGRLHHRRRIRNFKDRTFYRPDAGLSYTHIDALFGEPVNWKLIESHWEDLMKVAISIRQGKLSSVTLLRRLRHDSKRNKIYRAFRELGRVISTMVLLRYISDPQLRAHISKATIMVESYNGFAKWLNFGNLVIATNDPEDQEKTIKFNTLVADLVMFHTTLDMSAVINELRADGLPVRREDLAAIAPYQQDSAGRAGRQRHRRRPRRPSWCRGRPWSRSSAARTRRTRRGPWRAARGPRLLPPGPAAGPRQPPRRHRRPGSARRIWRPSPG